VSVSLVGTRDIEGCKGKGPGILQKGEIMSG
jgi:hypothetical protein